jgi:hypothetical protein
LGKTPCDLTDPIERNRGVDRRTLATLFAFARHRRPDPPRTVCLRITG